MFDEHTTNSVDPGGISRRYLIREGAGGILLAASGLILPSTLDRAAAEGALHGTLGGRRRKNRRGHQRNRRQARHKRKRQNDPGRGILRNFAFAVANASDMAWNLKFESNLGLRSVPVPRDGPDLRVVVEDDEVSVFIPQGAYPDGVEYGKALAFNNPTIGTVSYQEFVNCQAYPTYLLLSGPRDNRAMEVYDRVEIKFGYVNVVLLRNADSAKYKEF